MKKTTNPQPQRMTMTPSNNTTSSNKEESWGKYASYAGDALDMLISKDKVKASQRIAQRRAIREWDDVCQPAQTQTATYGQFAKSPKNKWIAVLLAFFLGGLGIHKFYLGKTGWGIVYLLFCWTWIPSIIAFIEMLRYLFTSEANFRAKYN